VDFPEQRGGIDIPIGDYDTRLAVKLNDIIEETMSSIGSLVGVFARDEVNAFSELSTTIMIMFHSPAPESIKGPAKSMETVYHRLGELPEGGADC
jgi:hypothetical protein